MNILTILDVVIGLAFLYLLLSLLCMVLQEIVAGINNSRGNMLFEAIGALTGDPKLQHVGKAMLEHPLAAGLVPHGWGMQRDNWFKSLLVTIMPFLGSRRPSYIDPDTFASIATDLIRLDGSTRGGPVHPAFSALLHESGNDMAVFRTKVGAWYKAATDRQTGLYKRKAQRWLFFYGLGLAILLNVDTLQIARFLWDGGNATHAAEIAAKAATYVQQNDRLPAVTAENLNPLLQAVKELNLPMGWDKPGLCAIGKAAFGDAAALPVIGWIVRLPGAFCTKPGVVAQRTEYSKPATGKATGTDEKPKYGPVTAEAWLGWLLTALALSLGAQFWFDTLGKVVGLRAAGRKPESPAPTNT
ncbi:MAG: hypothetical protein ACK4GK_15720 [Ferrovibrio sp.]